MESISGALPGMACQAIRETALNLQQTRGGIRFGDHKAADPVGRKWGQSRHSQRERRDSGRGSCDGLGHPWEFTSTAVTDELERQVHLIARNCFSTRDLHGSGGRHQAMGHIRVWVDRDKESLRVWTALAHGEA